MATSGTPMGVHMSLAVVFSYIAVTSFVSHEEASGVASVLFAIS